MNKKKIYISVGISLIVVLCLLAAAMSYLAFKYRSHVETVIVKTEPPEYKVFIPTMPVELSFCAEKVPLNDNEVRERIERELLINTFWNSSTILNLKRANRWFPVIEPILRSNGIPNDFKFMAVIESNLTNSVSSAGAAGFWQLTAAASKKYGLEVTDIVDERYNVEKSTKAACEYLKEAYGKYGSWTMAAASYNNGMNGMDRQIYRQKTTNYYNLYLNEETYRFVARILALKIIFTDPKKYGFDLKPEELYGKIETKDIFINTRIPDLANFASKYGINYKILKILNPWLRDNYLPNSFRKQYVIKIPSDNDFFYIGE